MAPTAKKGRGRGCLQSEEEVPAPAKKPRGRPKGSKNKPKEPTSKSDVTRVGKTFWPEQPGLPILLSTLVMGEKTSATFVILGSMIPSKRRKSLLIVYSLQQPCP